MKPAGRLIAGAAVVIGAALSMGPTCGGGDDGGHALQWYRTCGDPVCRPDGHVPDPAVPPCTASQLAGAACPTAGTRCDPDDPCNVRLLCATADPTQQPGGCPISRARFKRDIAYLDDAARARLADELRGLRLATYRYRAAGPGGAPQLGFIIDDVEAPARGAVVNADGDTVNLYGYTSLAVATIQRQAQQLDELARQVELLRQEVAALRDARR